MWLTALRIAVGFNACRSQSERIGISSELPFTLERYLEGGEGERLLVIPPIVNHPWILHMRPELSVIRRFCEKGFATQAKMDVSFGYLRSAGGYSMARRTI